MADDYTDNTSTHGLLFPGGEATGILEAPNDSDWFRISLTAGRFYTFDLAFTASNSYYQGLHIFDSQGGYLGAGSGGGANTIKYTIKAASTADYYIAARDYGSSSASALPYTLKASAGVVDDIGDTRGAARALTVGQKASATFEGSNDVDYFKVAVQAGVTYVVTPAWGANGGSVRVEDSDGKYVGGEQSFTATRTGDYYIALTNTYGPVMGYDITVAKAADDHAANQAGAGRLTVGAAAATGKLDAAGDLDWFGVQLTAGTTYWFTLGQGGTPAYYGSGTLRVFAEDGTVVATAPGQYIDSSSTLLLQYVPATDGKYYVEVSGNSFSTGTYAVRAELGKVDDHGSTQATATTIVAGSTVHGELAISDDVDVFKLAVTAGKTYLVALSAQALSAGSGITLSGQAPSGIDDLVKFAKPGLADYRVLTAATTGDYYITVGATFGRGTGSYDLAVTEAPADDFGADKGTGGVLAVGGTVRGTLDYTGDVDAFKVTLQYGAKYAFQLRGAGSGEGTLPVGASVVLQIAGTDGSYVYLTDSKDGTYTFNTTAGGDYTISVKPQGYYFGGTAGDAIGSYTLHAVALNGDTIAPALASYTPAANAGPLDNITLRFSEAVMRGAGGSNEMITLRDSLGVTIETYYRDDSRVTISGDTLTINPSVQLKPGSKYLLSVPNGAVVDLAGNKFGGNELLAIDTIATVTAGGSDNDYLIGLGNGAKLSGAGGVDTVIYGYDRGSYDVVRGAAGTSVMKKAWDSTGSADVLEGVERLMFSDVNVALDIDGVAGQAYRLYRAAFDRAPDKAGIGYWMGQLDNGLSLQDMARGFLNSGEFLTLYGTAPTDSLFVNKLYQNILHRAPDQAGVDYWLGVLDGGAERANVLVAFSEGSENQAAALQVIGNGFEYTPYG